MKLTTHLNNFKASGFDFDSCYFVLATPGQITPLIFDDMDGICFINCSFKEAIKISSYIHRTGKASARRLLEEIQSLIPWEINFDDRALFAPLLVALVNELKVNRTIFLETSGFSQGSITDLMRFCERIVRTYRGKKIFIADVSNAKPQPDSDITIYKIDAQLIDEITAKGLNNFTGRKFSDLLS